MTKLEIIKETVNHFSKDPKQLRSFVYTDILKLCAYYAANNTLCAYNGANNTHCAVGRCMLTKYKNQGKKFKYNTGFSVNSFIYDQINLDKLLSPKYRGHAPSFWDDLQRLHDQNLFWNEKGLSTSGEEFLKYLTETKYLNQ